MNGSDQKIYKDRLKKLKNLITKEFESNQFKINFEPVISIALNKPKKENERNPRIEFSPDEDLMTDSDSNIKIVFQQAIDLAKEILNDPPMNDRILQGQIQLTHDGANYNMRATLPSKIRYKNRWFSYFDLLGFSNLVREHKIEHVLPIYEDVLKAIIQKAGPKQKHGISYSWFSDTFIIFSKADSDHEFALMEQASRLFFQKLILNQIPVRGALTVGKLYTQQKKNIFLGEALIDAYEYGEKQKWLGFLLTPSVYHHLEDGSLHLNRRVHYRKVSLPGIITHPRPENVYAFAFNNGEVNGRNPYLDAVLLMKSKADKNYELKYLNTEKFIRAHGNTSEQPNPPA